MGSLFARMYRAAPPADQPPATCDRHAAEIARLTGELRRVVDALDLSREFAEEARGEAVRLRARLDATEDRDAKYRRRRYEQQHRTNALLDDRLAAHEGRPTQRIGARP